MELESQKADLDPGDPKVDALSEQVVRIVDALEDKAAIQRLSAEIETPT